MSKAPLETLEVTHIPIDILKPYKNNARTHSPKQIQQIASSITEFGFTNPILIDDNNRIMAGHGRVAAAKKLNIKKVPTICISYLTDDQIRAYILADNKIAENAGWDNDLLAIEFEHLSSFDLDFNIEITGFEMAEIDLLLENNELSENDYEDEVPELDNNPPITKLGDVWQLGCHRLICGDSLISENYEALMRYDKADMIFTDPPYNVPIDGHVCGNGKIKHSEFAMASGEMSEEQFQQFLKDVSQHMLNFSSDGSLHYICMDWRHIVDLLIAGKSIYSELKNICVWNKNNGGMGSLYRSKHEFVAVFKNGTKPHVNNIELGKYGRYRTNVWDYAGVNSFGENQSDLGMHPTVKPVAMVADAIKDCSKRGNIILDPFAGSGTTLVASEKTGRIARCIELDPKYCDVIVKRWQEFTSEEAVHIRSGSTFNELTAEIAGGDHE